jgi:hypothetical protein
MPGIEQWTEKNEDKILFHFSQENQNILQRFIEIGPGNRITTVFQSIGLVKCRMIADRLNLSWLHQFCNYIENYQGTTGYPHNTKEMLLEAVEFERWMQHERSRYVGLADTGQNQGQMVSK